MEDRPEHRVSGKVPPRPGCWTVTVQAPWFLGPRSLALGGPLPPQGWPRQRQWLPPTFHPGPGLSAAPRLVSTITSPWGFAPPCHCYRGHQGVGPVSENEPQQEGIMTRAPFQTGDQAPKVWSLQVSLTGPR